MTTTPITCIPRHLHHEILMRQTTVSLPIPLLVSTTHNTLTPPCLAGAFDDNRVLAVCATFFTQSKAWKDENGIEHDTVSWMPGVGLYTSTGGVALRADTRTLMALDNPAVLAAVLDLQNAMDNATFQPADASIQPHAFNAIWRRLEHQRPSHHHVEVVWMREGIGIRRRTGRTVYTQPARDIAALTSWHKSLTGDQHQNEQGAHSFSFTPNWPLAGALITPMRNSAHGRIHAAHTASDLLATWARLALLDHNVPFPHTFHLDHR